MTALAVVAAVAVGVVAFALLVARAIRVGAEKEMPTPPVPARLDPRAGHRTQQAAHTTFTTLLALVVLAGLAVAGAADSAAAGGVQ